MQEANLIRERDGDVPGSKLHQRLMELLAAGHTIDFLVPFAVDGDTTSTVVVSSAPDA